MGEYELVVALMNGIFCTALYINATSAIPRSPTIPHLPQAFLLLIANVDTSVESPSNYTMKRLAPSPPRVLAFEPQATGRYAVWHCHDKLTTSFDVWEVSTLDVIASSKKKGSGCAEIKDLFLEAGNRYIVSLDSGRPSDHAPRHQGELDFGITLLRD